MSFRTNPRHRLTGQRVPGGNAVVLATTVALTFSCASWQHNAYDPEHREQSAAMGALFDTDPPFRYDRSPVEFTNHITKTGGRYEIRRISFPSVGDNGQVDDLVTVDYHMSTLPGKHPVVIVLPIWGRHLYPSDAITSCLKSRSDGAVHILNVLGATFLIQWAVLAAVADEESFIDTWTRGARREVNTVIDTRRLMDWAETRPEIDAERIGLIGFSHGAMVAPTIAAQDRRVRALVLVMGGAHPHQVIAHCKGARTENIQDKAKRVFGWSNDELAARLEPIYAAMDPANYPNRVDPRRVLIFEAGRDKCIPETARRALFEAMGRPERYVIDRPHRPAFYTMTPLYFYWMRKVVWGFFEDRLVADFPQPTGGRDGRSVAE
jgi:hypothetical protein